MTLLIPDYDIGGKKYPKEMQEVIRHFTSHFFRGTVLFQVSSGRMILTIPVEKNPDHEKIAKEILEVFHQEHERYGLDYKIIVSDQHQVFGRMSGKAVLDDGTEVIIRDVMCFAEKVHNKY